MNPKYTIILSLFFTYFISPIAAQTKDESIASIRKIFQQTNAEKNLIQVKLENEELTDEALDGGISLTGYFKDHNLVKISLWTGLSYGIVETEYYFSKDSLVFVYVTEKHFRQTGDSTDHSKVDLKFEGRYYFKHTKLIHKIIKGNTLGTSSDDNEKNLLADSKDYLKILYTKRKRPASAEGIFHKNAQSPRQRFYNLYCHSK